MSDYKISRRKMITGSGLVLALPLFESLVPLRARAAVTAPKRALWLYMPNGTYNKSNDAPWDPPTGALTPNLPDVLSPFSSHISDFSVLKHLKNTSRDSTDYNYYLFNGNGGGHVSAVSTFLSAQINSNPGATSCQIKNPSIDQLIAQKAGKAALALHAGGMTYGADGSPFDYSNYISYANGKAITPISNPTDLYKQLFGSVMRAPAQANDPRKSALDLAISDLNDLKSKLGQQDRSRFDDFLTGLRAIETALTGNASSNLSCNPPAAPGINNYGGENSADYFPRVKTYFDLIAFALMCDLTRSVTFMFDGEVGERALQMQVPSSLVYNGGALDAGMHIGIAHNGGREKNITKDRCYMSLMLYLKDKLKAATDVDGGPLLDNAIIHMGYGVTAGDHGDGHPPAVLAGGRNMIRPGYSYELGSYDQKDLLFTIASKLNLGITGFEGSSKLVPV